MRCPSCGKENGDGEKSCAGCGTFLGPTLSVDRPSEDEVPTHLGLAVVAAGLPLLCATGGALSLLAVPLGVYAIFQARNVEQNLSGRKRDVMAATAASINAQRFALLAIVLAVVLGAGHFASRVLDAGESVERSLATGEADAVEIDAVSTDSVGTDAVGDDAPRDDAAQDDEVATDEATGDEPSQAP